MNMLQNLIRCFYHPQVSYKKIGDCRCFKKNLWHHFKTLLCTALLYIKETCSSHLYTLHNFTLTVRAYIKNHSRMLHAPLYFTKFCAYNARLYTIQNSLPIVRAYMSKSCSLLQRVPIYVTFFSAAMSAYSQSI